MTPGRCLRLAAFAPPLLLIPLWAASFVRYLDARVTGPYAAVYGALNDGRLDLRIHRVRRGFLPPAFLYGVYLPYDHDPFRECDLRFAGFGFGRTGNARFRESLLTCPPWFVPLALLAPAGALVWRRLRSAPAGAHR